ncbi:MAG: NAD-dependent epimerase/dehydratase family protein [Alphaproteobacteria bacterium]|nr:NAD-dependent epimerase/dehydratase family protein [Alphaproteobacteria bacterium]
MTRLSRRGLLSAAAAAAVSPARASSGPIIVFGGTGRLGAPIVKLLVAAGEDVTVFVRKDSTRERLTGLAVDYAIGDLTDDASVAAAFDRKSFHIAIDASAQRGESSRIERFYETTTRSIVTHAKRTGVRHLIHHGSIGAGANLREVPYLKDYKGTPGMIDKGNAERVIVDSGLPYTIIRNGWVPLDPQPPPTYHASLSPDVTTFSGVTRDDLAILTMDVIGNPARLNKIYHAVDATVKIQRGD